MRRPTPMKRIDVLFPTLPLALDGIGDYTVRLSSALAPSAHVRILSAGAEAAPVEGVEVRRAFTSGSLTGLKGLVETIAADPPDWLLLQYNPFSWGHWGFNPLLPEVLQRVKRSHPNLRLAVMVHEPFVPARTWQFAIMTLWQRWQLWRLGHVADVVFFSIEAWAKRFSAWFDQTPVYHLPIGSNIPVEGEGRGEARRRLGVEDRFVLGLFGSASTQEGLPYVRSAFEAVVEQDPAAVLLYVGPDGRKVEESLEGLPVRNLGKLPAPDVSSAFRAMDMYVAPFPDGVSTRRGTVMAALAHGVPVASLSGPLTDSVFTASIWTRNLAVSYRRCRGVRPAGGNPCRPPVSSRRRGGRTGALRTGVRLAGDRRTSSQPVGAQQGR